MEISEAGQPSARGKSPNQPHYLGLFLPNHTETGRFLPKMFPEAHYSGQESRNPQRRLLAHRYERGMAIGRALAHRFERGMTTGQALAHRFERGTAIGQALAHQYERGISISQADS